jgi:hypothetical protein
MLKLARRYQVAVVLIIIIAATIYIRVCVMDHIRKTQAVGELDDFGPSVREERQQMDKKYADFLKKQNEERQIKK